MTNPRPHLQTLIFEVTQQCNHTCRHCYNVWHPDTERQAIAYPRGELDTAGTLALLTKALDETRCRHVTLTGGEPLLHQDLPQILDLLRERDVMATIISNGRLLDEPTVVDLLDLVVHPVAGRRPRVGRRAQVHHGERPGTVLDHLPGRSLLVDLEAGAQRVGVLDGLAHGAAQLGQVDPAVDVDVLGGLVHGVVRGGALRVPHPGLRGGQRQAVSLGRHLPTSPDTRRAEELYKE